MTILWLSPMFCPYFMWCIPPILWVLFNYTHWVIRVLYSQSSSGA